MALIKNVRTSCLNTSKELDLLKTCNDRGTDKEPGNRVQTTLADSFITLFNRFIRRLSLRT